MAKPIIKQITPFDATTTESVFVDFVWTGFMAYNNRMIIYDANTMNVVYDHTYETNYYVLSHKIPTGPSSPLTNGKKYAVAIAVIDQNGAESDISDKQYFWVSKKPTFYFKDLSPDDPLRVEDSTYTAQLVYSQANNVAIDTYRFYLYNSVKEEIDASDVFKGMNSAFKYTYRTLDSNYVYYLRATGVTVQGVVMDTGYLPISVQYEVPTFYSLFYATPNPVIGTVDYYSNIIDIESDLPSTDYRYDNGFIDLTVDPKSVRYSKNFKVPKDATISLRMKKAHKTCNILKGETDGKTAWMLRAIYDEDADIFRFRLTAYGNTSNYVLYSEPLDFNNYDIVTVHIRRVNGIYGLYTFITKSDVMVLKNQWFDFSHTIPFPIDSDYYFNNGTTRMGSYFVSGSSQIDYDFISTKTINDRISNDEYSFVYSGGSKRTWFVTNNV